MKINCSYTKIVDIHTLKPNPENLNNHPDEQIEYFKKILVFNGQRRPVVVSNRSGFISKGHGLYMSAMALGLKEIAVDYQDYESEAHEAADMVADNELAKMAYQKKEDILDFILSKDLDNLDPNLLALPDFNLEKLKEVKNSSAELDLNDFDNFDHQCPKCGFEWSNNGSDNS